MRKKKPYEGHEIEYRRMKERGIDSWDRRAGPAAPRTRQGIEVNTWRFLNEALAQPWAPKGGQAVELGCGTGPILRYLGRKGFGGLGIDISRTAIDMARQQSRGTALRFRRADACRGLGGRPGAFDLVVDGHCLHCLTKATDRTAFLKAAHRLLKADGLFLILTMCGPVDRKKLRSAMPGQKLLGNVLYIPYDKAGAYEGSRRINGRMYLPTRYIGHWEGVLRELESAGFRPQLLRRYLPFGEDPIGDLAVAAIKARD